MKKILGIIAVAALLLTACSKEKKLNRKIDGTWDIVSVDGTDVATLGFTGTIAFNKDKKAGTFETKITGGGVTDTETGSYELVEDTQIIMTFSGGDKDTSLISSYSKTDMTMTSADGSEPVVLKKQ